MKPRCIKKPFDIDSWCGRCCVNDVLSLNSDSYFLNLLHDADIELCKDCTRQIKQIVTYGKDENETKNS